MQLRFH